MGVEGAYESYGDYYMSSPYDTIERLIDKHNVADVLLMVSDVISAKADHIGYNWQDMGLAEKWVKAGQVVRKAVRELPKVSGIK